ncbi:MULTISPECIES: DegT/DnrJ/EryC1/StrS aminotransferase family protein [unclassified Raoultella]|uniref:DegT/DnrJ/EryC1/StrS family aminotransferase n=1 Tax=unclassified Raoultella TaxID=2627600 RepID=UPI001357B43F|nr:MULTISPECIES: aminotransferase class I/II-fold pyridoxal phosphate-dependent enzyme [unclassified Raoultella]
MSNLPFQRRVPLLNMSLTEEDTHCAARWLSAPDSPVDHISRLHTHISLMWNTPWVASFMGGRASLYAVIRTLGLKPGDQIVIPAFTCQCVANAITFNGVEIVFADIESDTYGMSAQALQRVVTPRTRAIMIQYTFGLVCRDIDSLLAFARAHKLRIIEDCAHATGGKWQGKMLGTLGDIAFFSSERSKVVNTIHGGWVVTADPVLGKRLMEIYAQSPAPDADFIRRLLITLCHAFASRQGVAHPGPGDVLPQMHPTELAGLFTPQYAWKMAEPVAELLIMQLCRLDRILIKRRQGAMFWQRWAQKHGFRQPQVRPDAENTWLRFPIWLDEPKEKVAAHLEQALNIETGVWFTTPIHPQPCELANCPTGMLATKQSLNLPTWLWDKAE